MEFMIKNNTEINFIEKDVLNSLRGYYSTSFFHIYLNGNFSTNVGELSVSDRGTFMHEYIHYFQNIGTFWGLYCSIVRYKEMLEFKSHVEASSKIEIPVDFTYSEKLSRMIGLAKFGNGTSYFNANLSWNIQQDKCIIIKKGFEGICGKTSPVINLEIIFDDNRKEYINLGAYIIKENMAALYQSFIDPNSYHDDLPYNIIELICKQHFPHIVNDKAKLICICYTSLFSMTPGNELIRLLESTLEDNSPSGIDIFTDFINTKTIQDSKGNESNIVDYFDHLVDGFKKTLAANLVADLDYIEEVLNRVKLSNRGIPFLSVLYDQNQLSIDNINALIEFAGIPYIQTSQYGLHYPQSNKDGHTVEDASLDVLEMIAQEAMFLYFTRPQPLKVCPLYYMCVQSTYSKDGCFDAPWDKPECSFTIVSSPLLLDQKEIIWT